MEMLIEGAILAIIVVWLFLRDWRATAVSAVALPLSIIPTFWAIWVLGYTLNILTLLALSLVVGILVDDAIVEVENIVRHLRMGKKPKEAAMDAAIEIGLAVVATTLTICAVFVPVAFMSGIAGEFFGPFSFTVVVAVLCSLLVARTLTPMMAAYFLKPHDRPERPSRIMTWYLERVRWCLAHRWSTLGVATAAIGSMLGLFPLLSTAFSPAGDNGFTTLSVELAPGASLEDTLEVAETARTAPRGAARGAQRLHDGRRAAAAVAAAARRAAALRATCGAARWSSSSTTPTARAARSRYSSARRREILRDIPGARFQFASGGGGSRLEVTLAGDEPNRLGLAAANVEREIRAMPGLGHDHEQRGAAEARDRDPAAARARGRARRHDGNLEPRHAHRDERRRQHEPRRSSTSITGRFRSSCA